MPVSTDRTALARVKTYAIFVKRDFIDQYGRKSPLYVRRPYNIVEYDWNDGQPVKTYLQPASKVRSLGQAAGAVAADFGSAYYNEAYDDVRIYETPPTFDIIYGYSQYSLINNNPNLLNR